MNSGAALNASPDFPYAGVTVGSYNQSFASLNGAGNVIIWDEGTWDFIEPGDDPDAFTLMKRQLT